MGNGSIDAEDMKLSVAKLLGGRLLPRTTHALYVNSPASVRINLSSVLDSLWNDRAFKSVGDGTWCMGVGNRQEKTPLQKAMMVGPVWEPMFADMLRESGLPVEQQRHECGNIHDGTKIGQRGHYNCCNPRRGKRENGNGSVVVIG